MSCTCPIKPCRDEYMMGRATSVRRCVSHTLNKAGSLPALSSPVSWPQEVVSTQHKTVRHKEKKRKEGRKPAAYKIIFLQHE